MNTAISLSHLAEALGGDIRNGEVVAPGPAHSAQDRSLSVRPSDNADGFVLHSFADDDPIRCKDHVRERLNMESFQPVRASRAGSATGQVQMGSKSYNDRGLPQQGYTFSEAYDYRSYNGTLLYQVVRYNHPSGHKTFLQRRPDEHGGWLSGAGHHRVAYRLGDRAKVAHQTIFVCEGEKDADRLASLGFLATTVASGKWTQEIVASFKGFECLVLEDNDEPGRLKASKAAAQLGIVAEAVRIVRLVGLQDGQDISDWLDAGGDADSLLDLARLSPIWSRAPASNINNVASAQPRLNGMTAAELQAMVFPPVRYVVDGYLAEGLTILAGKPKLGKSWLVLDFCCAVANGGFTLGDVACQEGDVLYCALEDTPRRLKDRMGKLCPHTSSWPKRLTFWTDMAQLNNGGLDKIREWIAAQPNPRLVVIDVLSKVRSPRGTGEDAYAYDYKSVATLKQLADEFGIAVVVVHHTRKMAAEDPLEIVSGTNGLTGAADSILVLDRRANGCTLYGRGRDMEEIETAVEFQRNTCRWRVLGDVAEVRRSDERSKLLAALKGETEPMSPREIADLTGHPHTAVRYLFGQMAKAGEVVKAGRGKYLHPDRDRPYKPHNLTTEDGDGADREDVSDVRGA